MAKHSDQPDDVNELERRLSGWLPSREGLDADAVLFAAGRAAVRPGPARFAWPMLTTVLTALVVVLGLWLAAERKESQLLARRLQERQSLPAVKPLPVPGAQSGPVESPDADEPAPDSYLASRPALEKGLDAWPNRVVVQSGPADPSLTNPPILRLGQRDSLLDP